MSAFSGTIIVAILSVFYDDVHGKDAANLLPGAPDHEVPLHEWATGSGREYVKNQGLIISPDKKSFAVEPDSRTAELIERFA